MPIPNPTSDEEINPVPSTSTTLLSPQRRTTSSTYSQMLTPNNNNSNIRRNNGTSSRERYNEREQNQSNSRISNNSSISMRKNSPNNIRRSRSITTTNSIKTTEVDEEIRPMSIANETNWAGLDFNLQVEKEGSARRVSSGESRNLSEFSGGSYKNSGRRLSRKFSINSEERSPSRSRVVEPDLESGFSIREEEEDEEEEDVIEEVEDNNRTGSNSKYEAVEMEEEDSPRKSSLITLSKIQKNVLKCTLAYFLAELFTFVPILSEAVSFPFEAAGPIRNAHVIASVAVYFNPGRSVGAMIEANLFMLLGIVYSLFLCIGSMSMTVFLNSYGLEQLAHVLVVVLWIGVGFGILAYVKVKVNRPTMTTACSLSGLFSAVIITKSPSFHIGTFNFEAILQLLMISFLGILISNLVCFGLWRDCSTVNLQNDLSVTLSSFETLLGLLTRTFLRDPDAPSTRPSQLQSAITSHSLSFTLLQSSLSLSKYEFLNPHIQLNANNYDELVTIITKLSQGLTGIRSTMQHKKLEEDGEKSLENDLILLERFEDKAGDSLKNLSEISRNTLTQLRKSLLHTKASTSKISAFDGSVNNEALNPEDLLSLKKDLERSLETFKVCYSETITELYQNDNYASTNQEAPFASPKLWIGLKSNESDAYDPSDNLFRIYYFCFNYSQWVSDLSALIDVFIKIRAGEETIKDRDFELKKSYGIFAPIMRPFKQSYGTRSFKSIWYSITTMLSQKEGPFPIIIDGALTQLNSTSSTSFFGRLKQKLWKSLWYLHQPFPRFALKTGFGAALLASLAFLPTRSIWIEYRGEWALISYMVIMVPTLGGTNVLALGRIVGTALGGIVACLAYLAFNGNNVALPIFGALFSMPCFYVIITRPSLAPSARFVLLTFNLTCLYAFNLQSIYIVSIAFHRSIAVSFGVGFGLLIINFYPFEARRELRKDLSKFFLNSAYLYQRIVKTYSNPPPVKTSSCDSIINERTSLLSSNSSTISSPVDDLLEMEVYLQLSLLQLSTLLQATKTEPRLKGEFPVITYSIILTRCQTILDLLTSMRTVTTRDAWYTQIREDFVIPVQNERREMVGNVILYFSILASSLSLKTPLPAYLPPASLARERLIARLRQLPVVQNKIVKGGSGSEGLLYLAYAIAMKDVIQELEVLGGILQKLFGIIGGSSVEEFNDLFVSRETV